MTLTADQVSVQLEWPASRRDTDSTIQLIRQFNGSGIPADLDETTDRYRSSGVPVGVWEPEITIRDCRSMEQSIATALAAVLAGDVERMMLINSLTQDQLASAAEGMTLVLGRDAVVRVLTDYSTGRLASADVQGWASFVRRGYLQSEHGPPVRPLEIDWDRAHESAIAEAIARLDELGDLVDGTLREGEAGDLLNDLSLEE